MPNLYQSFMRNVSHTQWFSDLGKDLVAIDRAVQKTTRGKVSLVGNGTVPQLLLTVTGRKSGQPRTTPLLYAPDDGSFVVVGSNWGQHAHPQWTYNLLADKDAVVTIKGVHIPVTAELAEGRQRKRLWAMATEAWPAYETYADRSYSRQIRVFRLTPVELPPGTLVPDSIVSGPSSPDS